MNIFQENSAYHNDLSARNSFSIHSGQLVKIVLIWLVYLCTELWTRGQSVSFNVKTMFLYEAISLEQKGTLRVILVKEILKSLRGLVR